MTAIAYKSSSTDVSRVQSITASSHVPSPRLTTEAHALSPQTYLEQNEGPGLQHLALKTDDVLGAVRKMRRVSGCGGFDFMPPASADYYKCASQIACVCKNVPGKCALPPL